MHYLDNAATTRVLPQVADVINDTMRQVWVNPSSLYSAGMHAEKTLEDARKTLAKCMGAAYKPLEPKARQVFFTASGTEANNIAIQSAILSRRTWGKKIVATGYEHPCALQTLKALAKRENMQLVEIAPDANGVVDIDAIVNAADAETALVCAMHVNNETGAVIDVAALAERVKAKNERTFVHSDGVQGFCKTQIQLSKTKLDSYAVSGHKIHAPKGVGALYLKNMNGFVPLMYGGGQENGVRPGTENIPYIAGLAKAAELAVQSHNKTQEHISALRANLLAGLGKIGGVTVHSPQKGYSGIVMFSMPNGLQSQTMINKLDAEFGVCVSSGSACDGGANSHTLTAMGVPTAQVEAALRVSFCAENTVEDVEILLRGLGECANKLARK